MCEYWFSLMFTNFYLCCIRNFVRLYIVYQQKWRREIECTKEELPVQKRFCYSIFCYVMQIEPCHSFVIEMLAHTTNIYISHTSQNSISCSSINTDNIDYLFCRNEKEIENPALLLFSYLITIIYLLKCIWCANSLSINNSSRTTVKLIFCCFVGGLGWRAHFKSTHIHTKSSSTFHWFRYSFYFGLNAFGIVYVYPLNGFTTKQHKYHTMNRKEIKIELIIIYWFRFLTSFVRKEKY